MKQRMDQFREGLRSKLTPCEQGRARLRAAQAGMAKWLARKDAEAAHGPAAG